MKRFIHIGALLLGMGSVSGVQSQPKVDWYGGTHITWVYQGDPVLKTWYSKANYLMYPGLHFGGDLPEMNMEVGISSFSFSKKDQLNALESGIYRYEEKVNEKLRGWAAYYALHYRQPVGPFTLQLGGMLYNRFQHIENLTKNANYVYQHTQVMAMLDFRLQYPLGKRCLLELRYSPGIFQYVRFKEFSDFAGSNWADSEEKQQAWNWAFKEHQVRLGIHYRLRPAKAK